MPAALRELLVRFWGTLSGRRADRDLQEELRSHLELAADDLQRRGNSPAHAARLATLHTGSVPQAMEVLRDQRGLPSLTAVSRDVRYALRTLGRARGWTTVIVLSLALGIGANIAIFSAINGMLLTKVPVADPDTLVRFRYVGPNDMAASSSGYGFLRTTADGKDVRATFSYPMFQRFVADNRTMVDIFASVPQGRVTVSIDGQAELASAFMATGNYFDLLGVKALLGRTFTPADDRLDAPAAAVISSKYWQSRFGGDRGVLGRSIRSGGVSLTIVGVLPPAFTGVQQAIAEPPDVSIPLSLFPRLAPGPDAEQFRQASNWWLQIMGRVKPGATAAQVQGNLGAIFQEAARSGFDSYLESLPAADRNADRLRNRTRVPQLLVESGARGIYDVRTNDVQAITILAAVVALVLLLVCANVANLLLSRAASREQEVAVRVSLGATRGQLIRQFLTESLVLGLLGGAAGVLIAYWGLPLLPKLPGPAAAILDVRVFGFVLGISVLTSVLFGLVPAIKATEPRTQPALQATGRTIAGSRSALGPALLVFQIAISLALLVNAGLFLQTLDNLRHVDVGFDPGNLLQVRINPQLSGYDQKRSLALYRDVVERVAAVPGVGGAALSQPALLSGNMITMTFFVEGRTYAPDRENRDNSIYRLVVSPNFFDVMRIPLVAGRVLSPRDIDTAPKVAVINEAAARKFFPDVDPIGRRVGSSLETSGSLEIVGVVRNAKYESVRDDAPPTIYNSLDQTPQGNAVLAVRTAGAPASVVGAVREAVRQTDPNLPLLDVSTQAEQIERRFQQEATLAQAYTLFGCLALGVAAIGLFGLLSYNVSRRTSEIGIRIALGAERLDVLGLVMRESMTLVSIGIVAGLALATAASRWAAALVFGLTATDPRTMALAAAVMAVVSAVAGYLPARRALGVDPVIALKAE